MEGHFKNVESITNMMSQTSQKGLHKFIVTVEYYNGMWVMSSHRLKPLTRLTSKM